MRLLLSLGLRAPVLWLARWRSVVGVLRRIEGQWLISRGSRRYFSRSAFSLPSLLALARGVVIPFISLILIIPILWVVPMLSVTIGNIGLQDASYVGLPGGFLANSVAATARELPSKPIRQLTTAKSDVRPDVLNNAEIASYLCKCPCFTQI